MEGCIVHRSFLSRKATVLPVFTPAHPSALRLSAQLAPAADEVVMRCLTLGMSAPRAGMTVMAGFGFEPELGSLHFHADEADVIGELPVAGVGPTHDEGLGVKIGSLVHTVLERDRDWDPGSMENLAVSLGTEEKLPSEAVDRAVKLLRSFSGSDFAARLRDARSAYREVTFCVPMEALVEGVADLIIEEDDGYRVVDFKTDAVSEGEVEERAEHYRLQGACYALCLSEIIGEPVVQVIFYFLGPQKAHVFDVDQKLLEGARAAIAGAV